MEKKERNERLNGRDLINIGVYSAIYFVIVMALAMTGLIPISTGGLWIYERVLQAGSCRKREDVIRKNI